MTDMNKIVRCADALRALAMPNPERDLETNERAHQLIAELTPEEFDAVRALVKQRIAHDEEQLEALEDDR